MNKKIRHLEFYGFNDQNGYVGLPSTDLSEIHKTNKEQDRDISDLSKGKADVCMVKKVSDKLDTFIDVQSHINNKMVGAIKITFDNIDKLKHRDRHITEKINEIGGEVNSMSDELSEIKKLLGKGEDGDDNGNDGNAGNAGNGTVSGGVNGNIEEIESALENKLDKSEAEETYAKKEDIYTKEEVEDVIDIKLEGFATEEWVYSKGYISEDDADDKYACKAKVTALDTRIEETRTQMCDKYNALSTSFTEFKNETETKLNKLTNESESIGQKYDEDISDLKDKVSDLENGVEKNKQDISKINEIIPTKADKSSLDDVVSKVDNVNKELSGKLDVEVYEKDKVNLGKSLDRLDDDKADKSSLDETNTNLSTLSGKLELETINRENGDLALESKISQLGERIDAIVEDNLERDAALADFGSEIEEEIKNRDAADKEIIGSNGDRADDITLYGVRKYADLMSSDALNKAKAYADDIDSGVRTYSDEKDKELELLISGKANKEFVNGVINDAKNAISSMIDSERERAEEVESQLQAKITTNSGNATRDIASLRQSLTDTANIVNALTAWKGGSLDSYTDEGNGILDVLHREFHKLVERVEALEKKNLMA